MNIEGKLTKEKIANELRELSKRFVDIEEKTLFIESIFDYISGISGYCIEKKNTFEIIDNINEEINIREAKINYLKKDILQDLKLITVLKKLEKQKQILAEDNKRKDRELVETEIALNNKQKEIETKEKEITNKVIKKLDNTRMWLKDIGKTSEEISKGENISNIQNSIIGNVEKILEDMNNEKLLPLQFEIPKFEKVKSKTKKLGRKKNKKEEQDITLEENNLVKNISEIDIKEESKEIKENDNHKIEDTDISNEVVEAQESIKSEEDEKEDTVENNISNIEKNDLVEVDNLSNKQISLDNK